MTTEERLELAEEMIEFLLVKVIDSLGVHNLTSYGQETLNRWAEHRTEVRQP